MKRAMAECSSSSAVGSHRILPSSSMAGSLSPVRAAGAGSGLVGGAHLDDAAAQAHVPARLRVRRRPALDAAAGEPEGRAVEGAGDAAVVERPLVQRPAAMRAAVG